MRILLVSLTLNSHGASLALLRIADLLARDGHAISLLAIEGTHGDLRAAYEARNIPIITGVRQGAFDLAICNTVASAPAVCAIAGGCPVIWWLREAGIGARALERYPAWQEAFAAAARIVVQSRFARDRIYQRWLEPLPHGRVVVLPNGIEMPRASPPPPRALPHRVIGVGPAGPVKRTGDLIAAAVVLGRDDLEVVIVGDAKRLSEEEQAIVAASPQRFRLTGRVPREEAFGWIAASDVLAMTSASEAQSNVLAEGALGATALCASNLPVIAEFGWRHEETCLIHPVGAVERLAANIARLLDEPGLAERLQTAAAENARRHYSLETFHDRLSGLIDAFA
jgi:glycosyltransferase involved in cell wall biosynthesis